MVSHKLTCYYCDTHSNLPSSQFSSAILLASPVLITGSTGGTNVFLLWTTKQKRLRTQPHSVVWLLYLVSAVAFRNNVLSAARIQTCKLDEYCWKGKSPIQFSDNSKKLKKGSYENECACYYNTIVDLNKLTFLHFTRCNWNLVPLSTRCELL